MSLEGYEGPTSGRITVGGDEPARVERFHDKPLSVEETEATKWFTDLSPNEQIRTARALKWNARESAGQAKSWMEIAHRQRDEIDQLKAKLATYTPEGFSVPSAAQDLLDHAGAHGWKTGRSWFLDEDDPTVATLHLIIGRDGWMFDHLRWTCRKYVGGRMTGRGLARSPHRNWYNAPSLKKIKEIITEKGDDHVSRHDHGDQRPGVQDL